MAKKIYDVCFLREYERNGETSTEFMRVGVGFQLSNRDGISVEISVPLLVSPGMRFAVLAREERSEVGETRGGNGAPRSGNAGKGRR